MKEKLRKITSSKGEGLVLRKPQSKYESGRSYTILKVKELKESYGLMLETGGEGYCLRCLLPSGQTVLARCSQHFFNNPPIRGRVLTIGHHGYLPSKKLKTRMYLIWC